MQPRQIWAHRGSTNSRDPDPGVQYAYGYLEVIAPTPCVRRLVAGQDGPRGPPRAPDLRGPDRPQRQSGNQAPAR